jgi:hypothetical protein
LPLLLGRTTSQSNLPTAFKRTPDALTERSDGLRRLAFVIWCGQLEQHRSALPIVVEALVDAMQSVESAEQSGEENAGGAAVLLLSVFLCMRVVCVRVTAANLAPFWPLVTAELLRVLAADGHYTEVDKVVAAACQLLQLLRLLQPVAFASFESVFSEPYISPLAAKWSCVSSEQLTTIHIADEEILLDFFS